MSRQGVYARALVAVVLSVALLTWGVSAYVGALVGSLEHAR